MSLFSLNAEKSNKNFGPLRPGESVAVKLEAVTIDDNNNLKVQFKGTDAENGGSYTHTYWANNFDESDAKYNAERAVKHIEQLQQIIEAFVPKPACFFEAKSFNDLAKKATKLLTTAIGTEAKIKLVYKSEKDDKYADLPLLGAIISTDLVPRTLKLGTKNRNSGLPWERVLPLSHYDITGEDTTTDGPTSDEEDVEKVPF